MRILFALYLVLLFAVPAYADLLIWDANTEPDMFDYRVYSCTTPPCDLGTAGASVVTIVHPTTSWTFGVTPDTCYFVTARDITLNESTESNAVNTGPSNVCTVVDTTPPSAPANLQYVNP